MTKRFLFLFILLLPFTGYSQDTIYFNIYHNGASVAFLNVLGTPIPPMAQEIALRTLKKPFAPERIRSEYYDVTASSDILWQGQKVVQYDYSPISGDRFRHVLWVLPENSEIVKLEIYDNEDRMVYCAVCLECDRLNQNRPQKTNTKPKKDKKNDEMAYFSGFTVAHTEKMPNGAVRTSYSDGLNRFSIFKTPSVRQKDGEPETFIVYGNYVYSQDLDGFRYTVVGSVPFEKMAEMINVLRTPD